MISAITTTPRVLIKSSTSYSMPNLDFLLNLCRVGSNLLLVKLTHLKSGSKTKRDLRDFFASKS